MSALPHPGGMPGSIHRFLFKSRAGDLLLSALERRLFLCVSPAEPDPDQQAYAELRETQPGLINAIRARLRLNVTPVEIRQHLVSKYQLSDLAEQIERAARYMQRQVRR